MQKKLDRGRYFPLTAIQRFDAAVSSILPLIVLFIHIFCDYNCSANGGEESCCACRMLCLTFKYFIVMTTQNGVLILDVLLLKETKMVLFSTS